VKCRFCGTPIPTGGAVYTVTTVPPSLEYVFRGGIFCSEKCIRAFCLESLEILDTLDALSPKTMVTDLHEPRVGATKTLVSVLGA
jgi:ribosomal protein L24E